MAQLIIAIGRENGTGGRDIAVRIANQLHLPFYDVQILMDVAKEMNMDLNPEELAKYDEAPRRLLATRRIRGEYTNSVEEILAYKQFDYLKEKAESGESFVVIGRCADCVLKDYKGLVKIFINASDDAKIKRIAIRHNVSEAEAEKIIRKTDKGRKTYYERYSGGIRWGDPDWHDVVIKSDTLGLDDTTEVLLKYIEIFEKRLEEE